MSNAISHYNVGERVFRTAVFQNGVAHQCLEQFLIKFVEGCRQKTCNPNVFDPNRATKGLALWTRLGSNEFTVIPQDKKAVIHGVFWSAKNLEEKIEDLGGKWEKIETLNNGEKQIILAILPPSIKSEEWLSFEKDLQKFWSLQKVTTRNGTFEAIITCAEAEWIDPTDYYKKIFLHSNSSSVSYIMLKRRAGFYLGMKQDLCFYDPRGSGKSTGIPSEGGYYNDILAVYEVVKRAYPEEEKIWVSGACLECVYKFIMAYI